MERKQTMKSSSRLSPEFVVVACLAFVGFQLVSSGTRLGAQARPSRGAQPVKNPCGAPANNIVAENCKPGNPATEWDINGAGDPSIQGFSNDMSVNHGETISFKIKTDSPAYRIDIYRMGYYGGM